MGTLYGGYKEVVVSNERGKRVVNYYLRRRDGGGLDLAVMGKERTLRHMTYNVVIRSTNPSCKVKLPDAKLKCKREVVHWLASVVADSSYSWSIRQVRTYFDNDVSKDPDVRNSGCQSKAFQWVGNSSTCRKRRKHYSSYERNGIEISVHDFVYVLAEENKRLVAYLEDLYEDPRGNRMVVVRWFHKIDEVGIILPPNFNDREIFFSLCLQDLSVECIDGLATILSLQHFEKYLNEPRHTLWQPFLCRKQFDNDEITDFDITQVQGYWTQEIFRFIHTAPSPKHMYSKQFDNSLDFHDGDDNGNEDDLKTRPKKKHRLSKSKEIDRFLNGEKDANSTQVDARRLSNGFVNPSTAGICGLRQPNSVASLPRELPPHKSQNHLVVGCLIEVLSQDSGIRGCWFRAVVIKRSKEKVKVRYQDLMDAEDESKNVEEWVLASRIAMVDELGIRLRGRTTIRPFPPSEKDGVSLGYVNVGTPVDAWWHDGWWEGIVVLKESDSKIHVYFPGEKKLSIFSCSDLRLSQDWMCNTWNTLEGRPDIVGSILSSLETKQDKKKTFNGERDSPVHEVLANAGPGEGQVYAALPSQAKSFEGHGHSTQQMVSNDEQHGSNILVGFVSPKEEGATCNLHAPGLEAQNDARDKENVAPNFAKDNFLSQLSWNISKKRRRPRERRSQRWSSGSSSSSREEMGSSPDCQRFLTPNSVKFDQESCKYHRDSHLCASMPPLTGLVLSR